MVSRVAGGRRAADVMRSRVLDLLVGLAMGGLVSTALSSVILGNRIVRMEEQVSALRRDLDRLVK